MTQRMQELAAEIVRLQSELDREIEKRRKVLGWTLHRRLVRFEHGVTLEHRKLKQGVVRFLAGASLRNVLTAPVIYSMILPFALIDAWASLYQAICFRAYRIPRVSRRAYIVIDRNRLAYLNGIEALNCVYCAYANGVTAYVREIGARTEQYWCPIKHALPVSDPHERYRAFLEYGDAQGYRTRLTEFRRLLAEEPETRKPVAATPAAP